MILLTRIEVPGQSDAGPFAGVLPFSPGLQVISAPNAYGKSLAITAVPWCLGIEPIFGTRDNDSTCFPEARREELALLGHPTARVLSSECSITLRRENGDEVRFNLSRAAVILRCPNDVLAWSSKAAAITNIRYCTS